MDNDNARHSRPRSISSTKVLIFHRPRLKNSPLNLNPFWIVWIVVTGRNGYARSECESSPIPSVRGPVSARPTQGGKQPRRRPPPPPGGGDGDGDNSGGGPSNRGDTPRSRWSGVPSDRGDLQDAFDQMSDRQQQRLRKKNVQSVKHTSTITTVYKDGRPPSVSRTSTRESPAPNQNSV